LILRSLATAQLLCGNFGFLRWKRQQWPLDSAKQGRYRSFGKILSLILQWLLRVVFAFAGNARIGSGYWEIVSQFPTIWKRYLTLMALMAVALLAWGVERLLLSIVSLCWISVGNYLLGLIIDYQLINVMSS
jgi:hypothetical protein